MLTGNIFFESFVYCGLSTIALTIIGAKNPRIMLHKYPKEIQAAVPPRTDIEKKQARIYAVPFLLVTIFYPLYSGWHICSSQHLSFGEMFMHVWTLMLAFNIYDLIILDWLMFCTITPRFIVIAGTAGNKGYKNYMFHFVGFLKGIVITLVVAVIPSGLLYFICP